MAAKTISVEQRFELFSKLGANTNWDALDPSVVQSLIDSPRQVGAQFTEFIRNGGKVVFVPAVFSVWKTIKLGTGISDAAGFLKTFIHINVQMGHRVKVFLNSSPGLVFQTEGKADLVVVTPGQLGFGDVLNMPPTYENICKRAVELGLDRCTIEMALQLCVQYEDMDDGEYLFSAGFIDSRSALCLFSVISEGGKRCLAADEGYPGKIWSIGTKFVFVRRKS